MAALAELIRSAPDRVTGAVLGDARDRLSAAVSEVRRLQAELATIEHEVSARNFASLRSCADKSQPPMSLAASLINGDPDEAWRQFIRNNPTWRETLRQACASRLQIAEDQAREVETRVREELADGDFTEHEIAQHPRLASARRAVALWKSLRDQCATEKDNAALWKHVTKFAKA